MTDAGLTAEQAEKKLDEDCGMTTREVANLMVKTMQKTASSICEVARHQAKLLKEMHETNGKIEPPYVSLEVLCKIIEKDFK